METLSKIINDNAKVLADEALYLQRLSRAFACTGNNEIAQRLAEVVSAIDTARTAIVDAYIEHLHKSLITGSK